MNTSVTVARYHLLRPQTYLVVPLMLPFCVALGAVTTARGRDAATYLFSIFIYFTVLGMQAITRSLPFGLTLGASRRSFYSGTALFGIALALAYGLMLTVLQAIERATGGWGLSMHLFRVPYLLNGAWYATWLTSFVAMSAVFVYGMWHGAVFQRWGTLGTLAFIAVQALVVAAVVVVATFEHWHVWSVDGGPFAGLTAFGLTGVIAALAVLLLWGGHATIRRVTV